MLITEVSVVLYDFPGDILAGDACRGLFTLGGGQAGLTSCHSQGVTPGGATPTLSKTNDVHATTEGLQDCPGAWGENIKTASKIPS